MQRGGWGGDARQQQRPAGGYRQADYPSLGGGGASQMGHPAGGAFNAEAPVFTPGGAPGGAPSQQYYVGGSVPYAQQPHQYAGGDPAGVYGGGGYGGQPMYGGGYNQHGAHGGYQTYDQAGGLYNYQQQQQHQGGPPQAVGGRAPGGNRRDFNAGQGGGGPSHNQQQQYGQSGYSRGGGGDSGDWRSRDTRGGGRAGVTGAQKESAAAPPAASTYVVGAPKPKLGNRPDVASAAVTPATVPTTPQPAPAPVPSDALEGMLSTAAKSPDVSPAVQEMSHAAPAAASAASSQQSKGPIEPKVAPQAAPPTQAAATADAWDDGDEDASPAAPDATEIKATEGAAAAAPARAPSLSSAPGSASGSNSRAPLLSQSSGDSLQRQADDVEGAPDEVRGKHGKLKEPDSRPHLNIVFIGHVDAGKSTTCGNILYLSGQVDQRTIEKYEREAKEKNRDTWFFAFIVDINEEERAKGKTVEVGRATFSLTNNRFTILDAPGHKSFVPNMIGGAAQADVGVLIISARKGEFETGFERGGQTREHAMLAKTLGVAQLIVAVNKMDDPTCNWDEERFRDICKKLTPFLKVCGYNPAKDIVFLPMSGLAGQNLQEHVSNPASKCYRKEASWYKLEEPTLFEILDRLQPPERSEKDPLRIPLLEGFRDQGVMAVGKVEAGVVTANQWATLMPKRAKVKVLGVEINEEEMMCAKPGENVSLRLSGVEEDAISKGMVLCPVDNPCPVVTTFKAQVMIVELLEHRPILTAGYLCIIHAHTACEEVQITRLLETVDKTTKKKKINPQFVKSNSMVICEMQLVQPLCLETFDVRPQLGRFTLRDEGKSIAIGKVLEIID